MKVKAVDGGSYGQPLLNSDMVMLNDFYKLTKEHLYTKKAHLSFSNQQHHKTLYLEPNMCH